LAVTASVNPSSILNLILKLEDEYDEYTKADFEKLDEINSLGKGSFKHYVIKIVQIFSLPLFISPQVIKMKGLNPVFLSFYTPPPKKKVFTLISIF
jgi:hypothetical protein